MSKKTVNVHIDSLEGMGERFVTAWKAAEAGDRKSRSHITFLSLESFVSVMSPKRLQLLRQLRSEGASSIRALSGALQRDYKSVHGDVTLLADAGLIERSKDGKIAVTWDKVNAELDLAAA
jgi:predicted transcriptional regulator